MIMNIEEKVEKEIKKIANKYSLPEDLAQLKYKEIKEAIQEIHPKRTDKFYTAITLVRLTNYAKAYLENNGWEHYA